MNLEQIRKELDEIDADILLLLKKRMDYMSSVAEYKKQHSLAIEDKSREEALLYTLSKQGESLQLSEDYIRAVFGEIIKHSKKEQAKFL